MKHSEELNELAGALCAAQGEFEAVGKDSANPFFKSKYASLPAVVQAATPILATHGLAVTQLMGHDADGDTLTTMLMHKSGQWVADTMQLRPVKNDPQAQGSATTYGRRYGYMAALGLVADEDDDGNRGSEPSKKSARVAPKATPAKPKPEPPKADVVMTAPVDGSVVDKIREATARYGKDPDWLSFALVEVEADVSPINEAKDADERSAAFAKVIGSLRLEQAILLVESMGGTAQDLA